MRISFRKNFGNWHLSVLLIKTQYMKGMTSEVLGTNKHYIFWDLEDCSLEQAKLSLDIVQTMYKLSDIYITSDKPKSFRAWCFSERDFSEYLKILLDTQFLDYNFFYWAVRRGKATLRTSQKFNREPQKLLAVLKGYESYNFPEKITLVYYQTVREK